MAVDPLKVRELQSLAMGRAMLACRFDPTGTRVAAGGMNAQLTRCLLSDGKLGTPQHTEGHSGWLAAVVYHPQGEWLYSADYAGQLRCWNAASPEPQLVWTQPAHQGWIRTLAVSPDGRFLASAGNDKLVRVWSAADGKPFRTLSGHAEHIYSLAFHPVTGRIVSGDLKGSLKEWDIETGLDLRHAVVKDLFVQQQQLRLGGVRTMTFSADGKWLLCGGMSGFGSIGDGIGTPTVLLLDWETFEVKQTCLPKESARTFVMGAAFHPDGFVVAATGGLDRGYLLFWKIGQKEKEAFFQFKLPESAWSMDLSLAKNLIVTAHHDRNLRLYELPTAEG